MSESEAVLAQLDVDVVGETKGFDTTTIARIGQYTEAKEVHVGVVTTPEYQGLMLMFPIDGMGLLFRGAAAEKLLGTIDFLLHAAVESELDVAEIGENSATPKAKVTLH